MESHKYIFRPAANLDPRCLHLLDKMFYRITVYIEDIEFVFLYILSKEIEISGRSKYLNS